MLRFRAHSARLGCFLQVLDLVKVPDLAMQVYEGSKQHAPGPGRVTGTPRVTHMRSCHELVAIQPKAARKELEVSRKTQVILF